MKEASTHAHGPFDDRNHPYPPDRNARRPPLPLLEERPLPEELRFEPAVTYHRYATLLTAGVLHGPHGSAPAVHHRQAGSNHDVWSVYQNGQESAGVGADQLTGLLAQEGFQTEQLPTTQGEPHAMYHVTENGRHTLLVWSLPTLLCLPINIAGDFSVNTGT